MSQTIPSSFQLVTSGDLTVDQPIVADPWATIIRSQAYAYAQDTCDATGRVFADGATIDTTSFQKASASGGDLVGYDPIVWPRRPVSSDRSDYAVTVAIFATGSEGQLQYTLRKMNSAPLGAVGFDATIATGSFGLVMGRWTTAVIVAPTTDYDTSASRPPAVVDLEWTGQMTTYQVAVFGQPLSDPADLPIE